MYTYIFNFFERCIIFYTIFIGTGLLAEKPSLEYVPNSSVIWYSVSKRNTTSSYITEVDKFLEPYYKKNNENDHSTAHLLRYFVPCTKNVGFGFKSETRGGPCIFFKLTNIPPGWVPQTYNSTTIELSNLPSDLKKYALQSYIRHNDQFVLFDCEGESPVDAENIGPLAYFPARGIPTKHFPFKDTDPLVMVHFKRPQYGVVISVVCKAWAPNLNTSARIQLLIDY